jgi:RND family efflux transporter MFP subunit
MKTKFLAITLLIFAAACGGSKESRLEALKKQQEKLKLKIEQLEADIAAEKDSSTNDMQGTFIAVEELKYKPFNHYIEVQGRLDGDDNVAVYPESMGIIQEIYVKVGQKVTTGQVLARINDASYQEQLKSLQSTFELAVETFQKQENLWKQQIGSEIQYLQAKTNKESLEAQIASLKKQIDMTRIKSPINGDVEESMIKVGQAVSPSFPAFRVVNFRNLKVTADVAEAYAAKINVGDEVIVYLPDIKEEIVARVSFSSKYVNPTNRTFTVEARLNTSSQKLKANMVAVLKINDYKVPEAIVLPVNMIQTDKEGKYVLLAKENNNKYVASKQPVETGQIYNGLAEIINGLKPGEKVITSGYLNLNEGEPVKF